MACDGLGFTEIVKCNVEGIYENAWGWTQSTGRLPPWTYTPSPPWEYDPNYSDVRDPTLGTHGGCSNCIMTLIHLRRPIYTEAMLISCSFPANAIAGQTYQGTITVNQGTLTENYKLVFSGDLAGESMPFTVNAGTGQQQITVGGMVFPTGGPKTVTAALVKI